MDHRTRIGACLGVVALSGLCYAPITTASAQAILHVDDIAELGGDGQTWNTAYRYLQDALYDAAESGEPTEIRVGQGTYTPDRDEAGNVTLGDPAATFQLVNGIELLGGFAGQGAPDPDARDIELYETILSGDLLGDDVINTWPSVHNYDENSWHVVTGSGVDGTAVLEGFTLQSGFANGPVFPELDSSGAGMINAGGSPTVQWCTFTHNIAMESSGGMLNWEGSSPSISDCLFEENLVDEAGAYWDSGAMSNFFGSASTIERCTFRANRAGFCGGVLNYESSLIVRDCQFIDNVGTLSDGGGLYNMEGASAQVFDCLFQGNSSRWGSGVGNYFATDVRIQGCQFVNNSAQFGAGIATEGCAPTIIDCEFTENTADDYGGGIHNWEDGNPTVINCLFDGNSSEYGGAINAYSASPEFTNCLFVHNQAVYGAAMRFSAGATPILTNCTVMLNPASGIGGGIYSSNDSQPVVANSIFWDNEGGEITGMIAVVRYSDVKGGYAGVGNIDEDPRCIDPENDDMRIRPGSPCIDAGDNVAVPPDIGDLDDDGDTTEPIPYDLDGNPRFHDDPGTDDTGFGDPPFVDMGVYEFQGETIPADLNGDGDVDAADLAILLAAWGPCPECANCVADLDGDCDIDAADLAVLLANWT